MNINKFTSLGQLLGCYFHQDWPEEFSDSSEVIHEIISGESHEKLLLGVIELDQLIALKLSEGACREIMVAEIGCYFEPESEGLTYADWLLKVRAAFLEQ